MKCTGGLWVASASTFVKIPRERIGSLLGPKGHVKEAIEEKLAVCLEVDSQTGDIKVALASTAQDPSLLLRAKEVITAIGRGFSPERSFRLIDDDEAALVVIDLREVVGKSQSDMKRLKGRIIGKEGKTRRIIEELTEASISVFGHTISIIGDLEQAETARDAIQMFLGGSQHRTVYRFLHRKRRELKKKRMELWEPSRDTLDT
ncbi:MAG: RNA-processing protein [Candidatus Bathyarchaeota archaeon]|nr:MAG: RNA-processing protein [Candidatus Bathyarchaeota archaeon]